MAKIPSSVIGVDLGRHSLKAVLLQRKGGKVALTNYAVHVRTDDGSDTAATLAGELKELFGKMGGRAVACGVGVSRADSILRIIEQPVTPPEILREAVRLNGMALLNQEVKDFVLDCAMIEQSKAEGAPAAVLGGHRKYLVGGLPRISVAQIDEAFQASRGPLSALQLAPVCSFNAFEFSQNEIFSNHSFLLVDLGYTSSNVIVGVKRELVLVRAVNYGVKTLLEALTGGHTADPKAVFDMLDHGDETLVYNARNSLMMLAREISSSIGFFEGRHEETISRIFVSGAAARKSVLTLLTEDLQVPCEQWNPFENCEISLTGNQSEFLEHKSSLNIACGAAAELLRSN